MNEFDLDELKEKISIVDYISKFVDLQEQNGEWWGICPLHDEKTPSFSVNPEKQTFFCHGCKRGGSVIDFVCEHEKVAFPEAVGKLGNQFGVHFSNKPAIIKVLKRYVPKLSFDDKVLAVHEYLENPINKYTKLPIKEWIAEGIKQEIMDKYEVRYDTYGNRIVYPIWDDVGNIISVQGRTLDPDYKSKKGFDGRKYAYYTTIGTTYFFFGYWQNRHEIERLNEVIIFEGAKSVMKSEGFGLKNGMASLTDALTEHQIKELIKMPCRNVIIAWDKGVALNHIKAQVKPLLKYKNVFYLKDTEYFLEEKDSPVDKGVETFDYLYRHKERIV